LEKPPAPAPSAPNARTRSTIAHGNSVLPNPTASRFDAKKQADASAGNRSSADTEITVTGSRVEERNNTITAAPIAALASTDASTTQEREPTPELPLGSPAELRKAAAAGDMVRLNISLNDQVDINSRDDAGRTALMLATLHDQANAVKELLAHGADPNIADNMGISPLQAARSGGRTVIINALKHAGAR